MKNAKESNKKQISKVPSNMIGVAAKFAVASELCRELHVRPRFGTGKRNDLFVDTERGKIRIVIKGKQEQVWPLNKGVNGSDTVLVLVDFENKDAQEMPDFYILTADDWEKIVKKELSSEIEYGDVVLDKEKAPVFTKNKGTKGMSIKQGMVKQHKDCWEKIVPSNAASAA